MGSVQTRHEAAQLLRHQARLGVGEATMSRWVNGRRRPTQDQVRALAQTLRVPMRVLID